MNYCFHSIRRSGHHAVINWFLAHINDYCYINNISEPDHIPEIQYSNHSEKFTHLIVNMEDWSFKKEEDPSKYVKITDPVKFYILRNPFNMLASRLKSNWHMSNVKLDNKEFIKVILDTWKDYAKRFLNNEKDVFVYDFWFCSQEYRNKIAENIGFCNKDLHLQKVSPYAEGSSFDHMNYDGEASKMEVLNRYENYSANKIFVDSFDKEVFELTGLIFGEEIVTKIKKSFKKSFKF